MFEKHKCLEAIYWINTAYSEVVVNTIEKYFKKAGFLESVFTPGSVESETSISISDFKDENDWPLSVFTKLSKAVFDCEVKDLGSIDSELPTCNTTQIDRELPMSDLIDCINCVRNDGGVDHDNDNGVSNVCSKSESLEPLSKIKEKKMPLAWS